MFTAATVALTGQDGGNEYSTLGFVPIGPGYPDNGASLTLDFAFDDSVGAVIAEAAGQTAQAAAWRNRSLNYRNIWYPQYTGMCPRYANGSFMDPCPPLALPPILLDPYYTEGNGLQYVGAVAVAYHSWRWESAARGST